MLFLDMGTATVFEKHWGGDANFTEWVAFYASNVEVYGKMRSPDPKKFLVTVKHTKNWHSYPQRGPDLDHVREDIGNAQYKECNWIHQIFDKFSKDWKDVVFLTTVQLLKEHAGWNADEIQAIAK